MAASKASPGMARPSPSPLRPAMTSLLLLALAATWPSSATVRADLKPIIEEVVNAGLNAVGAPPLPSDAWANNYTDPTYSTYLTATNGVQLHVSVWQPSDGPAGKPLTIAIPCWGFGEEFLATRIGYLVAGGYVVVGYAPQGFGYSGGDWNIAGKQDVDDLLTVIDWAADNVGADSSRIGVVGLSYGAGLALMGAAREPRIRAVAALSGWGDMVASFYARRTPMVQSLEMLKLIGAIFGRVPGTIDAQLDRLASRDEEYILDYFNERSPVHYIDQLNANKPAVLFATGWRDSIFPPNENVHFFEQFEGPKRYNMRFSDHAITALYGIVGIYTESWDLATDWFDVHVKGEPSSGILNEPIVRVRTKVDAPVETADSFAGISSGAITFALEDLSNADGSRGSSFGTLSETGSQVQAASGSGGESSALLQASSLSYQNQSGSFYQGDVRPERLNPKPSAQPADGGVTFDYSFSTDKTTGATHGLTLVSNVLNTNVGIVQTVFLRDLDLSYGGIWLSPAFADGLAIRGAATLSINVESTASAGTIVAFLYDVDPSAGSAEYIQSAPYSFPIAGPRLGDGEPFARTRLDFDLYLALYDIPAGHRLMLVVQGSDVRLTSQNPAGSVITLSGDASEPATLTVPIK